MEGKGKSVTTSVPSIAIRFHANAEQLEELYGSDEDQTEHNAREKSSTVTPNSSTATSETESSPRRNYLPRLVKRSTSIDAAPLNISDSSPPSDPWRFFANLTGKITKSVEEKITEIKSRNQEESSPHHHSKPIKDSKENSSLSDSEELSESSISKTCGIVSTTEGVEMSSDDDTPSLEKDKKIEENASSKPDLDKLKISSSSSILRHRVRMMKNTTPHKESSIHSNTLAKLYALNRGIEPALVDENTEEVESGVDALEDTNLQSSKNSEQILHSSSCHKSFTKLMSSDDLPKEISNDIDNIEVDNEGVINIKEVSGFDIRSSYFDGWTSRTFFAPTGFVDLRQQPQPHRQTYLSYVLVCAVLFFYYFVQNYSTYLAGMLFGIAIAWSFSVLQQKVFYSPTDMLHMAAMKRDLSEPQIIEVPAIKEYQPVNKFEGWMNEYPDHYNPHTYHICQTQSVYLKLQGNLLRISNTKSKIPKRALWNEPKLKPIFTQHRIYNLLGAKITLLPEGLARKRQWSKKYPICIILNKDQLSFECPSSFRIDPSEEFEKKESEMSLPKEEKKITFSLNKKKPSIDVQPQRFSKLTEEEEEFEIESETSRPSSPSPPEPSHDTSEENGISIETEGDELLLNESVEQIDDDIVSLDDEEWTTFTPADSPTETCLFLFGRTDREKEDWFRRFARATHKGAEMPSSEAVSVSAESLMSESIINAATLEGEYLKYMAKFQKLSRMFKKKLDKNLSNEIYETEKEISCDVLWVNALMGRVLFDCMRDPLFNARVKERIQRKLSAIKLPYFIEELTLTELSLGNTPPLIHEASKPVINQRGLWIDLKLAYEGLVVLTMSTKLNLMKLKQPPIVEKVVDDKQSAIFNSDVDDTAESSTDDEVPQLPSNTKILDSSGMPVPGLGGVSTRSKKFIRMVDRIADSKIFKAATEIGYIKKAMEGVSNTDLGLKVELKAVSGILVLNIPPPPSDRIWIGFRPTPALVLNAQPIVGERNVTFLTVTNWIEKKLLQEFQKLLVIPNMEDVSIPVMCPKLPE